MPPFQNIRNKIASLVAGKSLGGGSFGVPLFNTPGFVQRDWLAFYQGYPYSATQLITQRLARTELVITETQETAEGNNVTELDTHPFYELIDDVLGDGTTDRYEFLEQVVIYSLLCGEVFGYTPLGDDTNEPKQVILLRPDLVTPAVDRATGELTGYVYNLNKLVPLDVEEVWTMIRFNPKNPYRGYGLVEAALPYIQTENYASRFISNYFFNDAKPASIVSVNGTMDKDDFMQMREQWKQEYKGVQNAGKVGFIRNAEVKVEQIGSNTEQSNVLGVKESSKTDILNTWQVSKSLLGEVENSNRASVEAAQYGFDLIKIDPEMNRLTNGLRKLFKAFVPDGVNQTLTYKSPIPKDTTEQIELWNAAFALGALTPNDVRDEMGKTKLTEGGDETYLPANMVAVATAEAEQSDEGRAKKYRIVGKVNPKAKAKTVKKKSPKRSLNLSSTQKEKYRATFYRKLNPYYKKFLTQFNKVTSAQKKEIMDALGQKALKQPNLENILDDAAIVNAVSPVVFTAMEDLGTYAANYVIQDSTFVVSKELRQQILDRLGRMAHDFNEQTREAIADVVSEGVQGGISVQELSGQIADIYDGVEGWQADRIARTELNSASNTAAREAWKEMNGVVTGEQWQADPQACEFCQALDGSVISLDQDGSFASVGDTIVGVDGGAMNVNWSDATPGDVHPNCILPNQSVEAVDVSATMKAQYSGPVLELTFTSGKRLSVTPNHMVATPRGWVKASELNGTDYALNTPGFAEWMSSHVSPDSNTVKALSHNVAIPGRVLFRSMPASPVNLHGDGAFAEHIDIVLANRSLRPNIYSTFSQRFRHKLLQGGDVARTAFAGLCPKHQLSMATLATANGNVGGRSLLAPLGSGHTGSADQPSLAHASPDNASILEAASDYTSANPELFSKLLLRFPQFITLDKLVKVKKFNFTGHVYDLTAGFNMYTVNDILTHNCECGSVPFTEEVSTDMGPDVLSGGENA